jgi:hypothetical protein
MEIHPAEGKKEGIPIPRKKHPPRTTMLILAGFMVLLSMLACADMFTEAVSDEIASSCKAIGQKMVDGVCVTVSPDEAQDRASSGQEPENNAIPAGTYEGKITQTELAAGGWVEWEVDGTVESNEVIIIVARDGTVTGQLSYIKTGNVLFSDDDGGSHATCTSSNDQAYLGEASGQLTSSTGKIVFVIQQTVISKLSEGCSIGPKEETKVSEMRQHFQIEIIQGDLFGTSIPAIDDGHPAKASFRLVRTP